MTTSPAVSLQVTAGFLVLHDQDRVGLDLQRGELVYGGGDLPQAAGGSAQDRIGDDDADLAGKRPQPERVQVAVGDVGGVGVLGRLSGFAGVGEGAEASDDHAAVPG